MKYTNFRDKSNLEFVELGINTHSPMSCISINLMAILMLEVWNILRSRVSLMDTFGAVCLIK